MPFPARILTTNATTGVTEGSYYNMTAPAAAGTFEYSTTYAQLVPAGETRPIRITHASVNPNGPLNSTVQHVLLVESPAGSSNWKIPLCWQKESQGCCRDAFNPGVVLSAGDELCMQTYITTGGVPPSVSYAIYYTIGL